MNGVRDQFPALEQIVHGHPLAYLDSAATALKPRAVIDAVTGVWTRAGGNIDRGVHALASRATAAFEAARERVARFVGAGVDEVIFCGGATEAINLVAAGWAAPRLGAGDTIVVTDLEHHSNLVPWQQVARQTGARLASAPIDDAGELDLDGLESLLRRGAAVVAVTHVSSVLGSVVDVARVAAMAREAGAMCLIDGAQAVAHRPVDVAAIGCDFYAFSGHKIYGPDGVGVLVGRRERLAEMQPAKSGGGMIAEVELARSTFAPPPRRFEAGTPPISGAVGLAAAIDWLDDIGLDAVAAREAPLVSLARERLEAIDGVRVLAAPSSVTTVSFAVDGIHPHDVATIADAAGVAIRSGHLCAQPLMARLGIDAAARASVAVYNHADEIERLAAAVERARQIFSQDFK